MRAPVAQKAARSAVAAGLTDRLFERLDSERPAWTLARPYARRGAGRGARCLRLAGTSRDAQRSGACARPQRAATFCTRLERRPLERHKGGGAAPPYVADGAGPSAATRAGIKAAAGAERAIWRAAGDARAWVAAMHCCAAWAALERGCKYMSAAAANATDSAEALGGAVGRDGSIGMDSLVSGASDIVKGGLAAGAAEAAFKEAADHSRLEASERGMAADAYGMAGASRAAQAQRGRAKRARKRAGAADGWSSSAAGKTGLLSRLLDECTEGMAKSSMNGWKGGGAEWMAMRARLQDGIARDLAGWTGLVGRAAEAKARAEGGLDRASDAAKRAGTAAGLQWEGGGKGGGGWTPGAQDAMDAWLAAMGAAETAPRG